DVLAQQGDLLDTLLHEPHGLFINLGDGPRYLHAAGVRDHAERAELVTALLHCQEGGGGALAFTPGQARELILVRKVRVDELAVLESGSSGEIREAVVGLRANNKVHDWSAGDDLGALRLGHATGNRHQGVLALNLPRELHSPQAAQLRVNLL